MTEFAHALRRFSRGGLNFDDLSIRFKVINWCFYFHSTSCVWDISASIWQNLFRFSEYLLMNPSRLVMFWLPWLHVQGHLHVLLPSCWVQGISTTIWSLFRFIGLIFEYLHKIRFWWPWPHFQGHLQSIFLPVL